MEVSFALAMMLFTFVIGASFVSIITTSMARFNLVRDQHVLQFAMLRKFLYDNGISDKLAARIHRNAQHVIAERQRHLQENSIEILALTSESLLVEMHFELHGCQ